MTERIVKEFDVGGKIEKPVIDVHLAQAQVDIPVKRFISRIQAGVNEYYFQLQPLLQPLLDNDLNCCCDLKNTNYTISMLSKIYNRSDAL